MNHTTADGMRVLFVVTALGVGGAERQGLALARHFAAIGSQVRVVSLVSGGAMAPAFADSLIPVEELGMRRGIPRLSAMPRFRRLVREWRPDIVHSHMIHANLFARLALPSRYRKVLICTAHSTNDGGGWRDVAYRITHRRAAVTTNVSRAGVAAFEHRGAVPRGGMRSMPNGITLPDEPIESRVAGERLSLLYVGRLEPVKAVGVLLEALALRAGQGANDFLRIVGDGPERPALQRLVGVLGLEDAVQFAGHQANVERYFKSADALILTSVNEGLPMVLLEAGASGVPVIATAVGGVPDLLGDDRGILVERSESQCVAEGMRRFASMDSVARNRMARRMREHIEKNFAIESVGRRWLELYDEVLHHQGRSS
ncbi:MAG TPA: glycosyltransferase [Gemmatimonadales bacterium]|nr:glycosyltransferase [Gemmatimonadales bacterium]